MTLSRPFQIFARFVPVLTGLLFLASGIFKLFHPGQATAALEALEIKAPLATATICLVVIVELYLGIILVTRTNLKWGLSLGMGLLFVFTLFLFYLSMLAHPPSCGCMMLTGIFKSSRQGAIFGVFRNCLLLWGLKLSFDYHFSPSRAETVGRGAFV